MQTFLPYTDFLASAKCLDYRRLGKQRLEAKQILNTLYGVTSGWKNHPAVLMWEGYEEALKFYHNIMIMTWISRGYKNTMPPFDINYEDWDWPSWLNDDFCASHRSNLLRKDKGFYGKYGWTESDDLPYIWPVRKTI
jgi:hypothetical protein